MADTPTTDAARFRPFRGAAWGLYLVVAVGYSCLVIYSVTKSVFEMSPEKPAQSSVQSVAACVTGLSGLFDELEGERKQLTVTGKAADADQRWMTFRNTWLVRMRSLEAQCAVDDSDRVELKRAFAELNQVMDQSTVQATQLAGQLGPALDTFKTTLGSLKK